MSCRGITCILDLDGTICPTPHKAHGQYLPLSASPAFEPVLDFLRADGRLAVVSTAGKRMWMQMFEPVQKTLQELYAREPAYVGRLLFGSYTGATFYFSDGAEQRLVEYEPYRLTNKTTMDPEKVPAVLDFLRSIVIKIFDTMAADPTYLPILSRKYTAVFTQLLAQRAELGADKFNATVLSMEHVLKHGRFLAETNDALLDTQYVVGLEDKNVMAHINVLGVPMARFSQIFSAEDCRVLETTFGISARAQPNSVCLAVDGLDKATPMAFMLQHVGDRLPFLTGFDAEAAFSGGDIPWSVDLPLAQAPPVRFVSVAARPMTPEERAQLTAPFVEVGGEEDGTAEFLKLLVATADKMPKAPPKEIVAAVFADLKTAHGVSKQ